MVARQIRVRNLATTISLQELEQTIQDAGLDQQNAAKVKQLFGAMGDAAETEGELFQHLRAIAAQIKAQGARPLRAITDYDEALMYARRNAPGDSARALPLLDAAMRQFADIGMTGWAQRAEDLRATLT